MGKVNISVNGRKYALGCDDGEESRLSLLGDKLDQRVRDLANQFGQIGDLRLLLMAGITMLDDLEDADDSVNQKVETLAADIRRAGEKAISDADKSEIAATESLLDAATRIERLAERLKDG